jgi:hypothetical protein
MRFQKTVQPAFRITTSGIEEVYYRLEGFGLKALAVYRDGFAVRWVNHFQRVGRKQAANANKSSIGARILGARKCHPKARVHRQQHHSLLVAPRVAARKPLNCIR